MRSYIVFQLLFYLVTVTNINALASPVPTFTTYMFSIELWPNMTDLFWNVDNDTNEVIFELHVRTTGYIGLGISPGMASSSTISEFCVILLGLFR